MGLSADSAMAGLIGELAEVPLIACSDAHSCGTIAREAMLLRVGELSFAGLACAIRGSGGAEGPAIQATYGLDPRLGKYHRSACRKCEWVATDADGPGPQLQCPRCGETGGGREVGGRPAEPNRGGVVCGVLDRIRQIASRQGEKCHSGAVQPPPAERPPYHNHIPLRFIPGIGPRTYDRLLSICGSELAAMHSTPHSILAAAAGDEVAGRVIAAREGLLPVESGGGGRFGRVLRPSQV